MQVSALYPREDKLGLAHLYVACAALFVGAIFGVLQALVRNGTLPVPVSPSYYQYLTAHGILMAIVFTTFFILGFLVSGTARALGEPFPPLARQLSWVGFWTMLISTVVVVVEVLSNSATVLYTFYAPLQASALFYIALTTFVVGSWITGVGIFIAYTHWRRAHPGQLSPLFAFMAVATMVLWLEATVGVAIEAIFQLIPWSLGWEPTINVELSRTLFWYFGHPLVYFWLLPAYIAWYTIIPRIVGGHIFSDSLARLAFILLIVFSIPVGFHHEMMDTGISANWKFVQVVLTYCVVIPSLMTAFAVTASLERAGRARGGRGLFGWIWVLPWGDPRFLAPACGMLSFVLGGAGGMVNASYEVDATVHNTLWIVGHFHVTLATSVVLTFFGITYWMLPMMTGKALWGRRLAIAQTLVWVVGMTLMSGAMHIVGLLGDPRRTASTNYGGSAVSAAWDPYMTFVAIGGSLLGVGVIMFLAIVIGTTFSSKRQESELPIATPMAGGLQTPAILERWIVWVGLTVVLVLLAYGIPVWQMIHDAPPGSPGFHTW
jgi:cytochrome c oxidase subunit I